METTPSQHPETTPADETRQPRLIADGTARQLDPRSVPAARFVAWIVTAGAAVTLGVAAVVTWVAADLGVTVGALMALGWTIIVGGLTWWLQTWPAIWYRHASYVVNPEGLEIRRGVLFRKVISVPRSRVQHTDVTQGPIDRRFGLGTLDIYTAGTDHAKVDLPGLDHDLAFRIRDHLLPLEASDAV
ncbi:MAG: PH domain-containing protein [Gemmatimonadetes bacterium]|nr:PH domain-containing protein [Gemmatimonadota bacterium]